MNNQKITPVLGLIALGLILRIIFLLVIKANWPGWDSPTVDALYHHLWAQRIADGDILGGGAYFRAPFYPFLLGMIYSIIGENFTAVFAIQHLIGVFAIPLVYIIAKKYFPMPVAIIATLLTAINGTLIYFESQLLLDFLTVVFYLLFIYLLTIAQQKDKSGLYFISGLIAGLFAITRPNILAVLPLACLWVFLTGSDYRKKIIHCGLLIFGTILLILPVTIRNAAIGGDNIIIASQGGINFYIGNNENADGYTALLPGFGHSWQYSDAEYEAAIHFGKKPGELKPSEVSSYYYGKAVKYILSSPGHFIKLITKKLYLFWNRFEISNNNNIYFLTDYIGLSFYPLFLYAILSPFGLTGTVLCFFKSRRYWIFPIMIIGYMTTVVLFFVTARFRLPVVPLLTIMASFTIYEIITAFKDKRNKYAFTLLGSVIIIAVLTWTNFYDHHDRTTAMANYSLGNMALKKGDYETAKLQYHKAIEQGDCIPNAHLNLGVIAFYERDTLSARLEFEDEISSCGKSAKAFNNLSMLARLKSNYIMAYAYADSAVYYFPNFKEAYINRILASLSSSDTIFINTAVHGFIDEFPSDIAAKYYYGQYLNRTGHTALAEKEFKYAASSSAKDIVSEYDLSEIYSAALPYGYNPNKIRGKSHYQLGLIFAYRYEIDSALFHFQQAVGLIPDNPDARHNLALAYDQQGDFRRAIVEFQKAIEQDSMRAVYYYNYGLSLGKVGDYTKSAVMMKRALELDPDFVKARRILETLQGRQ